MHNLVKEIAGIDFNEFGDDIEVAKRVTLDTLGKNLDNKDKGSIEACRSIGHLLNEVDFIQSIQFLFFSFDKFSSFLQLHFFSFYIDIPFFCTFCIYYIVKLICTH